MSTIEIYCKANKRTRDGQTVSVCAHIIKEGELYEEDAYTIVQEGNGVKLELAALMNALLDIDAQDRLDSNKQLDLYVHNEYILKTLLRWEATDCEAISDLYQQEEKYQEEWQEIGGLIGKCKSFKVYGFEKKYRREDDEMVAKYMGHINRMVCNKVNE
ncbi:MAG: hypothetical protein ACRCTE_00575 [Cellulosilyticaceae bacterium]